MAAKWTRIKTKADWDKYVKQQNKMHGAKRATDHTWNSECPPSYPTLVSSIFVPVPGTSKWRVFTCFVTEMDIELLKDTQPTSVPAATLPESATEYFKKMQAHYRAIISELIAVGVTNEGRYMQAYQQQLASVDQETEENIEKFLKSVTSAKR